MTLIWKIPSYVLYVLSAICTCLRTGIYRYRAHGSVGRHFEVRRGAALNVDRSAKILLGDDVTLDEGARIFVGPSATLHIASGVFVGRGTTIVANQSVVIGERTQIAHLCTIIDSDHEFCEKDRPMVSQGAKTSAVKLGTDVWLGAGSIVLKGVTVGTRAVVGAGAVVTHDVAEKTVVAGNPAQLIRKFE